MKKAALIFICIFLFPYLSNADTAALKLRASSHPGYIRIVLEGPGSVIGKGSATRKGNDILVSFPGARFSIQPEGAAVAHSKIGKDIVKLSPGDFTGIKAFTLKEPFRLVIDVYTKGEKGAPPAAPEPEKESVSARSGIKTVVIDPGHGGYENGIEKDAYKEKNTVLDIAQKLAALINSGASRGVLTRGSDRFMSLGERVNFANGKGPDVFISLHIGRHKDIVIYTPIITDTPPDIVRKYLDNKGQAGYETETLTLLKAMRDALISAFGEDMVSVKPIPYSIISKIEGAALVIEFPSFDDAHYTEEYNSGTANTLHKGLNIYEEAR